MGKDIHGIDLRNISPDVEVGEDSVSPKSFAGNIKIKPLYLVVSLAGALGALTRYFVAGMITSPSDTFPLATFAINVTGTFFLAFILILILERFPNSSLARPLLATGFCGAYTTFSTFMVEDSLLIQDHLFMVSAEYFLASTLAGLLATLLGAWLARFFYELDSYLSVQEISDADSQQDMGRE